MSINTPNIVGVGLKPSYYEDVMAGRSPIGWFEVHTENYMGEGGVPHYYLSEIAKHYPISMHGVGMSLGSGERLDAAHLARTKELVDRYQPTLVSEHVAWNIVDGRFHNDLLPLPYTEEALANLVSNIVQFQDAIGRSILIENPSTYLRFKHSSLDEPTFMKEAAKRSGCGLILDINNVYVSSVNTGFNAHEYIDQITADIVGEVHLAGHTVRNFDEATLLIDDHGSSVSEEVWNLFEYALQHIGPKPTLIEWDNNVPKFEVLIAEAALAQNIMSKYIKKENLSAHG
jgi:hypothetical protein